eukprot:9381462-Lingulodinium_polyedra.AAC.1
MADRDEFTKDWQAAKRKVAPPPGAPVPAKGSGEKRRKAGSRARADPPRTVPPGDISQADLRCLTPPGGHIWIGNQVGSWNSHQPPFSRFSASWHLHGSSREAALAVLRDMWTKYLTHEAPPLSACQ